MTLLSDLAPKNLLAAAALLACTAGPALAAPTTFGPGSGGTIPDANAAGRSSTITVADTGTVAAFTSVTITGLSHSWIGDLILTLSHGGVSVDLLDRVRGDGSTSVGDSSNLSGDYTFLLGGASIDAAAAALGSNDVIAAGSYAPHTAGASGGTPGGSSPFTQTLGNFAGLALAGDWVLNISDRAAFDTGSFRTWSFTVDRAQGPSNVPEPSSMALLALAAAAGTLASRRRRAGAGAGAVTSA